MGTEWLLVLASARIPALTCYDTSMVDDQGTSWGHSSTLARQLVKRTTEAQGLPECVEDPAALKAVAVIITRTPTSPSRAEMADIRRSEAERQRRLAEQERRRLEADRAAFLAEVDDMTDKAILDRVDISKQSARMLVRLERARQLHRQEVTHG